MNILGINAYHANASAAIVCDGRLVTAVEEERFNRVKYAAGFPFRTSIMLPFRATPGRELPPSSFMRFRCPGSRLIAIGP